ncbi:MAG: oligopeptide:H+ symporter [Planctomycetaceae bacterium]|nr:oligopeptide:H+ symporter [Planctomycetaceae bacterium]
MSSDTYKSDSPQVKQIFGHPTGLWVLFTTELWERFAFYTMRAILVLYLVSISSGAIAGFGWTESDAYKLYGWYTGLVYLAPLLGGWIADRFIGQRMCVVIGAVLMALGEFCLAATEFVRVGNIDITGGTDPVALWTFYAGLGLMILGNGFFKPCISVMVGQLYAPGDDRRRDSAFMIFYMGINIGAFLSPLVGGTIAEIYGYQYGFLIAGFGMIFGIVSFLMFGRHLKGIGNPPAKHDSKKEMTSEEKTAHEKAVYEQTRPLDKKDYDRMFVITVLAIFVIAFWIAFEQAGSSLNIFAKANTDRTIAPVVQQSTPEWFFLKNEDFIEYKQIVDKVRQLSEHIGHENPETKGPSFSDRLERFNIIRLLSAKKKEEEIPLEEQIVELKKVAAELKRVLRASKDATIQDAIVKLMEHVEEDNTEIVEALLTNLDQMAAEGKGDANVVAKIEELKLSAKNTADKVLVAEKIREELKNPILVPIVDCLSESDTVKAMNKKIAENEKHRTAILQAITVLLASEQEKGAKIQTDLLAMDAAQRRFDVRYVSGVEPLTFPATWYQSVNAMCVVIFVPLFMLLWGILARLGIEPSTPTKFALGLLLVSTSFLVMIPGAFEAKLSGGKAAAYWLLLCYLLATWGELCLSPIGLSMVTKLSPARYASMFMGVWFLASSVSYILAGYAASYFGSGEGVSIIFGKDGGLADFFLLMAFIPFVIGLIALAMAPTLKRKMHGVS